MEIALEQLKVFAFEGRRNKGNHSSERSHAVLFYYKGNFYQRTNKHLLLHGLRTLSYYYVHYAKAWGRRSYLVYVFLLLLKEELIKSKYT